MNPRCELGVSPVRIPVTAGLVQVAWVLQAVRRQLLHPVAAFVAWQPFVSASSGLFLWEAFVTGAAKQGSHVADARAGAEAFLRALPNPMEANAVVCQSAVCSLVGATLLRTGWSFDPSILKEPCLVVRAGENAV